MLAVRKGDLHAVVALLQCGADSSIKNDQGITALGMLPERKDPVVKTENLHLTAQILLDNGAGPIANFPGRRTPLAAAVCVFIVGGGRYVISSRGATYRTHPRLERYCHASGAVLYTGYNTLAQSRILDLY